MDIDLVYLYVNSNDQDWLKLRQSFSSEGNNSVCRFRDNNELLFSLRSVDSYLPWVRKIFIVSNSKAPEWLDLSNPRLRWVDHSEFMPPEALPCFNSSVIESYLHCIEDLSECFIYQNDDQFIGRAVSPSFFFRNEKPILRLCKPEPYDPSYYFTVIQRSQKAVNDRYHTNFDMIPWHNTDAYRKSYNKACFEEFQDLFENQKRNQLRNESTDIHRLIFHYYYLANNLCPCKIYDHSTYQKTRRYRILSYFFPGIVFDYFIDTVNLFFQYESHQKLLKKGPKVFCLNDGETTTEEDIVRFKQTLKEIFPNKSQFEKKDIDWV